MWKNFVWKLETLTAVIFYIAKILGCRDPRCKHEYLYIVNDKTEMSDEDDDDGDESDKHI